MTDRSKFLGKDRRAVGVAQASQAYDIADLRVDLATASGRIEAHEEVCTERWTQANLKFNWIIGGTFGTMLAVLGYTVVYWVKH